MALENKKLSAYGDLASANIDTTTKFVVLTGATKVNANLPVTNFIEDSLTSTSVVKPLSAAKGKLLEDTKAPKANPEFTGTATLNGEPLGTNNLNGTNYLMVYGTGTPEDNAAELQAAYDVMPNTIILDENGNSANNATLKIGDYIIQYVYDDGPVHISDISIVTEQFDVTIGMDISDLVDIKFTTIGKMTPIINTLIIAPSYYTFGVTKFTANKQYVNIVSLTGNADVKLDGINVTADYIYIKGIDCGSNAFTVGNNLPNSIFENCIGGQYSFVGDGVQIFAGKAINCSGGNFSFASGGTISGTIIDCIATSGFADYGTVSGTIIRCTGAMGSFASDDEGIGVITSTAIIENCKVTADYFGGVNALTEGKIINCINADGSVYSNVAIVKPKFSSIPTSSAGLTSGMIWSNSGVLTIVS